jgi:hypothetical protein
MAQNLRIWRVVPTSKTGAQAPTFFVETTEEGRDKAEVSAMKQARNHSRLGSFENWNFKLIKTNLRIDKFGRYVKYHQ